MQRLRYLARHYFHQDWDLHSPTPVGVVRVFRDKEVPEAVDELRAELEELLASNPSEQMLATIWDTSGADWDPALASWGTYREWFEAMLKAVS